MRKGEEIDLKEKRENKYKIGNTFSGQMYSLNKSKKIVYVYLNHINRGKLIFYMEKKYLSFST